MPLAKNPAAREFYVYRLEVDSIPFYVGTGRSGRASDRVRYVKALMSRERQGLVVKWSLSCAVIAEFLRRGTEPSLVYVVRELPRAEALAREKIEIGRLIANGEPLVNIQHNPRRPKSPEAAIAAFDARRPESQRR